MKKTFLNLIITLFLIWGSSTMCFSISIDKVGEWGTEGYQAVAVNNNYAYCCANYTGFDIIDISTPEIPQKKGNYVINQSIHNIVVIGNYAYAAAGSQGLHIVNISDPTKPTLIKKWTSDYSVEDVYIKGQYAYIANNLGGLVILNISNPNTISVVGKYVTNRRANSVFINENYAYVTTFGPNDSDDFFSIFYIFDISTPATPTLKGTYHNLLDALDICIKDEYAYISDSILGIVMVDVSNPSNPELILNISGVTGRRMTIDGNYLSLAAGNDGLQIYNISIPTALTYEGRYITPGFASGISIAENFAYIGDSNGGLQIVDITTPAIPGFAGSYDNAISLVHQIFLKDNFLYIANGEDGMQILNVSNPSQPVFKGNYNTQYYARAVKVRDNLAFVADDSGGLLILDISNPSAPTLKGVFKSLGSAYDVVVEGNYAYIADWEEDSLIIVNISDPTTPQMVSKVSTGGSPVMVRVNGNYAYVADERYGLKVFNISNPSTPVLAGSFDIEKRVRNVFVDGNYAYVSSDYEKDLWILDISLPNQPKLVKNFQAPGWVRDINVKDQYAFIANFDQGLRILDISTPSNPVIAASFFEPQGAETVEIKDDFIYLGNNYSSKIYILKINHTSTQPQLTVNRDSLFFATEAAGASTSPQSLLVSKNGVGNVSWTAASDTYWLKCSPASGTNNGEISVSIDSSQVGSGTYNGVISITSAQASNSPLEIPVRLKVYQKYQTSMPFGEFSTPIHGSTVRSSVPFTGWVLDDIGIEGVQLFMETREGLAFIGDAIFVEGARPDVEQTYPNYPENYKAGWGYMMLTNFLPNGNGEFTFHAYATDMEGNQVNLGSKTITVDNANAIKPFGALDTPAQGGLASGNEYINFGWVLSPLPHTIPVDGTTIQVWVDGVSLGNPEYNRYREDIASLFPDNNNSNGAGGYFHLDTTQYSNGVHTIQWTATDNAGNTDGIGSRYFTIVNSTNSADSTSATSSTYTKKSSTSTQLIQPDFPHIQWNKQVKIKKGYSNEQNRVSPDKRNTETITLDINELDRVEIKLSEESEGTWVGYQQVGANLRSLPIGSTLNSSDGTFYWQTGVGFFGRFHLIFFEIDKKGNVLSGSKIDVMINPKS